MSTALRGAIVSAETGLSMRRGAAGRGVVTLPPGGDTHRHAGTPGRLVQHARYPDEAEPRQGREPVVQPQDR